MHGTDLGNLHLLQLLTLLQHQESNEMLYRKYKVDSVQRIGPDVLTRFAIHPDGGVKYSTNPESVPLFDGFTERCEGINLGKDALKRCYLVTIQAGHEPLSELTADLEASFLYHLLPVPGSHFGTSAHADRSFETAGVLYTTNLAGIKQKATLIEGEFSAFYAGHGHLAIMTANRFHVIAISVFLERARNSLPLINPSEGRLRQSGELLIRGWQQTKPLMAVLHHQGIRYYDVNGQEHAKYAVTMGPGRSLEVPGVDRIGLQDKRRITITLRRDSQLDAGFVTRSTSTSAPAKRKARPLRQPEGSYPNPCSAPTPPGRSLDAAAPSLTARTFD